MADEEKPPFDPNQPFTVVDTKPPFDPSKPLTVGQDEQTGAWEAAGRGALSGVTAGFSDELAGADAASGLPSYVPNILRMGVGAGRMLADKISGNEGPATKKYDETVEQMRKRDEILKKQHPYAHGAGELAGSVVGMAALPGAGPLAQGARFLPRVGQAIKSGAQVGAEYGALAGAGEGKDLGERVVGAGTGAVAGGIGGGAGGILGETIGAGAKLGYDYFGKPLAAIYRGLRNPEEESLRRGAGAIMQGQPNVAAGRSLGLTPTEWLAAKQAGEPVMLADMGGETGRALLRSAANTDPEGRSLITSAVHDRFEGQGERAGQVIRGLVSSGADAFKRSEQLLTDYNKYRKPLYDAAYKAGDRPIWSPELERLASIPAVEGSLKSAVTTGANRAGAEGYGGFNPGVKVTPDGRLEFAKGPKGVQSYPNLQFWDYAYRDLRDKAGAAFRAGEKDHGGALNTLANNMRAELDTIVPQYGVARGHAAQYFGGENALEAGANAVKFKGDARELQATVAKIKNQRERRLFEEGYVSELAQRMENIPDRNDITKRIFQSPQDRKRIEAVLGPQRTKVLQTFLDRETIYDSLRGALGNSTTARQLIEAGLAGGGIGAYLGNGDPMAIMQGVGSGVVGGGAGVASGMRHGIGTLATAGAQRVIGYVDRNTAKRVAEFLTSDDPNKLLQGLALVQKNPRLAAGMRDITDRVSIAAGARALPHPQISLPSFKGLQSPSTAGADEDQRKIPRPPAQQHNGGQIDQVHSRGYADGGVPGEDATDPEAEQPPLAISPQLEADEAQLAREAAAARVAHAAHPGERKTGILSEIPGMLAADVYRSGKKIATGAGATLEALQRRYNPQEGDVISDSDVSPEDIAAGTIAEAAGAIFPAYGGKLLQLPAKEAAREVAPRVAQFAANAADKETAKAAVRNEAVRDVTDTGFYSHGAEAAQNLPQETGTPQQMRAMLEKQGVKKEEFDNANWDLVFGNKPKVTKQEVSTLFKDSMVPVQEVEKGGASNSYDAVVNRAETDPDALRDQLVRAGLHDMEAERRIQGILDRDHYITSSTADFLRREGDSGQTKFGSYQLPGGKNYRELLLTLPEAGAKEKAAAQAFEKTIEDKYGSVFEAHRKWTPEEKANYENLWKASSDATGGWPANQLPENKAFRSSHWDEPNVLAHVRMNDRIIDGKKTLFVEEIQSDWHQKGRRQGYAKPASAELTELRTLDAIPHDRLTETQRARGRELMERNQAEEMAARNAVPDAPFKTTWPDLAMKRVLKYAADNGYDQVAWTTGKTQAERYDLSKHVDKIDYNPESGKLWGYDKSGAVAIDTRVPKDKLADHVGKDVADKLLASDSDKGWHRLTGTEIKVSAPGMEGFYDKILPAKVNALVKKHGTKVETKNIAGKGRSREEINRDMDADLTELDRLEPKVDWSDVKEGTAAWNRHPELKARHRAFQDEYNAMMAREEAPLQSAHVVPITPSLRDELKGGVRMFANAADKGDVARNETMRAASDVADGRAQGGAVLDCDPAHPERQSSAQWDVELRAKGGAVAAKRHFQDFATPEQKKEFEAAQQRGNAENRSTGGAVPARADGGEVGRFDHFPESGNIVDNRNLPDSEKGSPISAVMDAFDREYRPYTGGVTYPTTHRRSNLARDAGIAEIPARNRVNKNSDLYREEQNRPDWTLRRANGGRVDPSNINHEPSAAQAAAGNYAHDHVRVHGLDLSIENAKGSTRKGVGADGKPWEAKLSMAYGYIKRTTGADSDHLDIYLAPHIKSPRVYVIDQVDPHTGKWDEHKAILGAGSEKQARDLYAKCFSDGKGHARIGRIHEMAIERFKSWLENGDTTKPFAHTIPKSEKREHASVGYVEESKHKGKHCSNCTHYIPGAPPACEGVKSPIAPVGWCRRYHKATSAPIPLL